MRHHVSPPHLQDALFLSSGNYLHIGPYVQYLSLLNRLLTYLQGNFDANNIKQGIYHVIFPRI